MGNHYHAHHEESFLILEGEVTVWMNCREKYILREGDLHRCDPNEMHYLRNDATRLGRLLFIKAPAVPEDRIDVPWLPGEPEPQVAPQTSA
jgi:quercetin dioxygenase-like cupin family protein